MPVPEALRMALTHFGFVVTGTGLDPAQHRLTMSSAAFSMTVIGVTTPSEGVAAAVALRDEGVQLIELCGGFGPRWTARVIEAIDGSVPVGAVAYGPESIDAMHALFAPA